MRRLVVLLPIVICTLLLALAMSVPAFGYYESKDGPTAWAQCSCHNAAVPNPADAAVRVTCQHCHGYTTDGFPLQARDSADVYQGPHGNFTTASNKCASCHTLHDAPAASLLPADSIVDTCWSCHDGTGGFGVYGTIKARGLGDPATDTSFGSHRIQVTAEVPGGDADSGGTETRTFLGPGGLLICTDCHSVHGQKLVNGFMGERRRTRSPERQDRPSAKLLRQQPSTAATPVAEYGSDWCAGCHTGRLSGMSTFNHPVDSSVTNAAPFVYRSVAGGRSLGSGGSGWSLRHNKSGLVSFGLGNYDFLMVYPRTAAQGTHKPICQQCHEDSRIVGSLSADGTSAVASPTVLTTWPSADGLTTTDNPRFQNFPHETVHDRLLVEDGDDLCLNCHPLTQLP